MVETYVRVDTFRKLTKPTGMRAISGIVQRLTNNHQMHLEQIENLYKFFWDSLERKTVKVTAGGLIWQKATTKLQQILVTREPRAVPDVKMEIHVGEKKTWDNYFYVTFHAKPYSALKAPTQQEPEVVENEEISETLSTAPPPSPPPPSTIVDDDLFQDGIPRYSNPITPFPKHIFDGLDDEEPRKLEPELGPPVTRAFIRKMEDKDIRDLYDMFKWVKRLPLPKTNCFSFPVVEDEQGALLSIPHLEFCARRDICFVSEPVDISVGENEHNAETLFSTEPKKKK